MKKILIMSAALFVLLSAAAGTGVMRKVVFSTTIECKNCARKVVENVSFEKGVKDLRTEVADRSVTIVYDSRKTDTLKLGNAIRKLGYRAQVVEDNAL